MELRIYLFKLKESWIHRWIVVVVQLEWDESEYPKFFNRRIYTYILNYCLPLYKYNLVLQDFLCTTKYFLISSSKVRRHLTLSSLYLIYLQTNRTRRKKNSRCFDWDPGIKLLNRAGGWVWAEIIEMAPQSWV